jgi:cell division protein FtsB
MAFRFGFVRTATQKISSHLVIALVIVGLLIFVALFLYQSLQIQAKQNEYNQTKQELALLQERNDQLQEHLDFYKGPGYLLYVEKVAREALNMVKPGETVVLASKPDGRGADPAATQPTAPAADSNAPPAAASTATGDQKPRTNWQNWLAFFVGQ